MTTKAQLLTASATAYEAALAEHDAAQQEQQRIYDLLKVSDERCKTAIAAVSQATQELMLAAQAKEGSSYTFDTDAVRQAVADQCTTYGGSAAGPWMVMYRRYSPPSCMDPLGKDLEDVAVLLAEFNANEAPQEPWQSIRPIRSSELARRYPLMKRI